MASRQGRLPGLAGLEQSLGWLRLMLMLCVEQPRNVPGTAGCPWSPCQKDMAADA